jgi:signal transduction histidine kinase/DNA-binding response OmpR family regulator
MSVALIALVALIVAALTGLIFVLVSRVFDSLTPASARDLAWKARRGAIELSETAELGLVIGSADEIRRAADDYLRDPEVVNVIAVGIDGQLVFAKGASVDEVRQVMRLPAGAVHELDGRLVSWAPATIEGGEVGRMVVAVSTSRLAAGDALRRQISLIALGGGGLAVLLAFGFVALYIWPVLRLTQHAFVRLEHTTEQALEAARLKAQFLANMSHEIRTPMNAVVGLSKLMLGMPLSTKLRRYAEMIDASSRALLGIINDILDFSKLEAGKYQIIRSPCEVAQLVQEVAELLSGKADEKGIDLVYRVAPAVPRVTEIDPDRVRQVLTNLVANAIKFTERGEVYILVDARTLSDTQVELRLSVHDTGPGISEEMQTQIFEAFSQGDGSLVRKQGGTGLGLTISQELVRLMGGALSVESELGKGSEFSFTLPARVLDKSSAVRGQATSVGRTALIACDNEHARTAIAEHVKAWGMTAVISASPIEAEEQLRRAAQGGPRIDIVILSETQTGLPGAETLLALRNLNQTERRPVVFLSHARSTGALADVRTDVTAQLPQPVRMSELYECVVGVLQPGSLRPAVNQRREAKKSYRGAHILVVDDNQMNQFVAAEQLELLGCTVDQAMDGQQAVDAVFKRDYALVLMDCQMPVMDGYTATRTIRARERADQHTVIIALTAHALDGERERVTSAGMDDYLTKPLRPQTLQRALERWIKGVHQNQVTEEVSSVEVTPPGSVDSTSLADCSSALLQMFLEQVPAQLEQLDGAVALGELEEAQKCAHKLKGSLLTVDADELASLSQAVQFALAQGDVTQAESLLAELVRGVVALEASVRSELLQRTRARRGVGHG